MRTLLTIFGKLLFGLFLGVVTLGCVAYFAVNSSLASRAVAAGIGSTLPRAVVALAGLEVDAVPVDVHLHDLAFRGDGEEPVWRASHVGVNVDPWSLLAGDRLRIRSVQADGVHMRLVWNDEGVLDAVEVLQPPEKKPSATKEPSKPVRPVVIESISMRDSSLHIERAGWEIDIEGYGCEGRAEAPAGDVEVDCGWEGGVALGPAGADGERLRVVLGPSRLGHLLVTNDKLRLEGVSLSLDGQILRGEVTAELVDDARLPRFEAHFEGAAGTKLLAAFGHDAEEPLPVTLTARGSGEDVDAEWKLGEERSRLRLRLAAAGDNDVLPRFDVDLNLRAPALLTTLLSQGALAGAAGLSLRLRSDGAQAELALRDLDIPARIDHEGLVLDAPRIDELRGDLDADGFHLRAGLSLEGAHGPEAELAQIRLAVEGRGKLKPGVLARLQDGTNSVTPQDIEEAELEFTLVAARLALAAVGVSLEDVRLPKAQLRFSWQPAGRLDIAEWTVGHARVAGLDLHDVTLTLAADVAWPKMTLEHLTLTAADQGRLEISGGAQASFASFRLSLPTKITVRLEGVTLLALLEGAGLSPSAESRPLLSGPISGTLVVEGDLKQPETLKMTEVALTAATPDGPVRLFVADEPGESIGANAGRVQLGPVTLGFERGAEGGAR